MTPQQIDALKPGTEMDALVAEKVMGWKIAVVESFLPGIYHKGWADKNGKKVAEISKFHPSTSIADAWEVMEKVRGLQIYCHAKGGYTVRRLNFNHGIYTKSDEAPEAISKAAVKAVMA